MKTKQLGNVLIKIVGLSELVRSVTTVITGIFSYANAYGAPQWALNLPSAFYPSLILAGTGVLLIVFSRMIADVLFKEEEE